jgi:hypothetical protein
LLRGDFPAYSLQTLAGQRLRRRPMVDGSTFSHSARGSAG